VPEQVIEHDSWDRRLELEDLIWMILIFSKRKALGEIKEEVIQFDDIVHVVAARFDQTAAF